MTITILGAGCGKAALTEEARRALEEAELVVGAKRLLDDLSPACKTVAEISSERIAMILSEANCDNACVLLSGDTGFYSGARRLLPLLQGHKVRVLPGVSSVQALAARLGRPWQDWTLCSAHGVDFDVRCAVCGRQWRQVPPPEQRFVRVVYGRYSRIILSWEGVHLRKVSGLFEREGIEGPTVTI